jgi:hypothetical protein
VGSNPTLSANLAQAFGSRSIAVAGGFSGAPSRFALGLTASNPTLSAISFRDTRAVELLLAGASSEDVATILGNPHQVAAKHYAPWVKGRRVRLGETSSTDLRIAVVRVVLPYLTMTVAESFCGGRCDREPTPWVA